MAKLVVSLPGQSQDPGPAASRWERLLWRLFNSPGAQVSGFASPVGLAALPRDVAARVAAENPALIKWVIARGGRVIFGPASTFHDELAAQAGGMNSIIAGGTIDSGKVHIFSDVGKAVRKFTAAGLDTIRQNVARAWVEGGRETFGALGVGVTSLSGRDSLPSGDVMLSEVLGLPRQLVKMRWQTLQRLTPAGGLDAFKNADEAGAWFRNLNGIDKLMMVLQPGQPLLRDFYVAQRMVRNSDWYGAFLADQKNKDFMRDLGLSRGVEEFVTKRATPEQQAFLERVRGETLRLVQQGEAYKQFQQSGLTQQMKDDFVTSIPYIVINPLSIPMRVFGKAVVGPTLQIVGRGVQRVAPGLARQFMRLSVVVPDVLTQKVLKELEAMRPMFRDPAKFDAWLEKAKPTVLQLRDSWTNRFANQQAADGTAAEQVLAWRQRHGVKNEHFHMVEQVLARKDSVWREWQSVQRGLQSDIADLTAQMGTTADPALRATLQQRLDQLNTQLLNTAGTYAQRIRQVTVDSVVRDRNLPKWTAADTQKATALGQDVFAYMRTLYPRGAANYRPYYFPEFDSAAVRRLMQSVPSSDFAPYELSRPGAKVSTTPEESVRRLHQRLALPEWLAADEAYIRTYRKFVEDVSSTFEPEIVAGLRSRLSGISTDILDERTLRGISGALLNGWKQAVLIGRLPAWVSINTLGNTANATMYLIDNWSRGRFVNPIDFIRRMNVPLEVLEGMSASVSVGQRVAGRDIAGQPLVRQLGAVARGVGLGHIRESAFALNNIVEMGFRGAIYKAEVAQALRELARDGVRSTSAYQLANQMGWDAANRYMYNYTNRYVLTRSVQELAPFLTYNIENVQFWTRELVQNPWLIPQMHRLAEERPEIRVNVDRIFSFLGELGIDARAIDLVGKTNWLDFFTKFREYNPPWLKENKERLSKELANVLKSAQSVPENARDAWINSQLDARPDLKLYKTYIEQGMAAHLVGYSMRALGANAFVEWAVRAVGITPSLRKAGGLIPQQEIIGYAARRIAERLGLEPGIVASWFQEPTDAQVRNEMRRLELEAIRRGSPLRLDTAGQAALRQQARGNVVQQRISDRVADLFVGGQWVLRYQDDLREILQKDPTFDPNNPRSRVELVPPASRVFHYLTTTKLDRDPTVSKEKAEAWATWLARRELLRGPDLTTPEQRQQRQIAFEALPEDLRQLREVQADPNTAELLQTVEDGFRTLESITDPEERRRFWQSDTTQVRMMKAVLDTRYTSRERVVVDEVAPMSPREQEVWWKAMRQQDPEKARLYEELYPNRVRIFRDRDIYGDNAPPPTVAPGTTTSGQPYVAATRSDPAVPAGVDPKRLTDVPEPAVPAPPNRLSQDGLRFVQNQEGLRLTAYRDPGDEQAWKKANAKRQAAGQPALPYAGRWAIGYGHTGPDVREGMTITQEQAGYLFQNDVRRFEEAVASSVNVPVNQKQFDALVSFAYNVGIDGFQRSTLLKKLNAGDTAGAALEFRRWVRGGGGEGADDVVLPGLVQRRAREAQMFQESAPMPTVPPGPQQAAQPDVRRVPADQRDEYRVVHPTGEVVYRANIAEAMREFITQVNPALDPKVAQRIVATIMEVYTAQNDPSPGRSPHSFDPTWIAAIIAVQTKFNPDFAKGGRFGLGALLPHQAPTLTREELLDPAKNTRALIEWFKNLQREFGTQAAVERLGGDFVDAYRMAEKVLGVRPVWFGPAQRGGRAVHERPLTEDEVRFADFYRSLWLAGGNREDTDFNRRRQQEWSDLATRADAKTLEQLKIINPDLFYHVQAARTGQARWWSGRVAFEVADPEYLAWKHRVLGAENLNVAMAAYKDGPDKYRERFTVSNGDMARFFRDRVDGVQRNYDKWEFTDNQDPAYLDARQKIARAMGTGDPSVVRQAVREIRSIYGDDMSGFVRRLKTDSPVLFESLKPYMEQRPYGPDEKLQVRNLQVTVDRLLNEAKVDPRKLRDAAAVWRNPANTGVLELAREHETAWFDRTFRLLQGESPTESFIHPTEHLPFRRFLNAMQDARQAKDPNAMRQVWQSVPEHFRQEYMLHHSDRFANDEAILEGVDPAEWVATKRKRLYQPYLDYLQLNDPYGPYSPEKLEMILRENPSAAAYLMENPEVMGAVTSGLRARQSALYTGILRQFNYNPSLLNAIPDDGTRYLVSLTDPNAKAAFERYKISVTKTEFPRIKSIQEIFGEGSTVEAERDDQGRETGRFVVSRSQTDPGAQFAGSTEKFTISAQELARQQGALLKLNPESAEFKAIQEQFQRNQGIVQGLELVYRGIQISQQGGGFFEQLPSYFSAAQTAAQAGLFTGPAATFLLGPTGFLLGGVLGILGGIFGDSRRRAEEERRRREAEKQAREQAAEALLARVRSLDRRQLLDVDARTGTISRFLEQPTAITRQALIDALQVPRPTW